MDLDAEGLKYITLLLHIVCVTKKNMLPKKNLWEIPVSSIRQTEVELFCVITLNATGSIQTPADWAKPYNDHYKSPKSPEIPSDVLES